MNDKAVWRTRVRGLGLVFVGGALGTGARTALTMCTPATASIWMIFAINTVGAALLGALLEALTARSDLSARSQTLRLLLGTGLLGGFTTYSTFAVDSAELIAAGSYGLAAVYVSASLASGLAGAVAGIAMVRRNRASRSR